MSLLLLLACTPGTGPIAIDDEAGGFFDRPWPSDERLTPEGGLDMTGFPLRGEQSLIDLYTDRLETVVMGAGPNAPIYFRFDGALDTEQLPTAAESIQTDASVFLVDIDPSSPYRGERIPLEWDFQQDETTFQPSNLLAVAPLPGAPMRPSTTYAAVVTTAIAAPSTAITERFDADGPDYEVWRGVHEVLFEQGIGVEEVASATVFTTQDPVTELAQVAEAVRELGVQTLDQELHFVEDGIFVQRWEGSFYLPVWQHGERPYGTEGGAFSFDEDGDAELYAWERVSFTLTLPVSAEPPESGWPVVLYQHGTYGDWTTCASDASGMGQASRAAQAGLAMFCFSQPLHGDRMTSGTDSEFHTFNYFNPDSAVSTFRQGALDAVYVAHVLSGRSHAFDLDGVTVGTDPDTTLFMGHSQGGITGAMALPFIGDQVEGAVLSGAGGGLAMAMVYRDEGGLDIEELVVDALDFSPGEELDTLHPVAGLLQTIAECTDSMNYARYWFDEQATFSGEPVPVLMFEGLLDEHTPPITTEAMASAAGVPVLEPVARVPQAQEVLGPGSTATPTSGNATAWDGSAVTSGLAQYPDQDHFAIHNESDAADLYRDFLESVAAGAPEIGVPPVKLLVCVGGGIAAYKACELTSLAVKAGWQVQVAMTRSATRFVGPLSFEALSSRPVFVDTFEGVGNAGIDHIELPRWAEVACVAPATANLLGKLACGIADDGVSTLLMALRRGTPCVIAPAMNTEMWLHPVVQRNLGWLEELERYRLVDPVEKRLACGDEGVGGLAAPAEILAAVTEAWGASRR